MDALAKAVALMALVAVLACPLAMAGDADAEGTMDGLMLYQVNPAGCEGVAVHNYGDTAVDMADYTITDNPSADGGSEGTLTFDSITVGPGETLVIASEREEGDDFSNQDGAILYGDRCTASGRFALADSGDGVYLFRDGECVDAVLYGNCTDETDQWTGGTADHSRTAWTQRSGTVDSDTADDWYVHVEGQTHYGFDPDLEFDATVTPFLFPDSGGIPIYYALESATESIRIEIYQLTSKNVIALLCEKAAEGVTVQVLLEGNSLYSGNDPILSNSGQLRNLIDSGGEVRLIGVADESRDDRYDYVHAKYAIIDGDTVVVTSENWTAANLNGSLDGDVYDSGTEGNRGWGAIVESEGYAGYMDAVFENDWSTEWGDVKGLLDLYPNITASETFYDAPDRGIVFDSYRASVTPVLSNDNSYEALEHYVSNASWRAYSQQQSLGSSYTGLDTGPVSLFADAADRGVDCRLVFGDNVGASVIQRINASTNVRATGMDAPYVHNKGVVIDDVVWVSSVNWTDNSFHDNRECCVVIHSQEVADLFAAAFLEDFDRYYSYDGFTAYISEIEEHYESGAEMTVTVTVSPEAGEYTYLWDLGDGSDARETDMGRVVMRPQDGTHTLTVTITDGNGNTRTLTAEYTVGDAEDGGAGDDGTDSEGGSDAEERTIPYAIIAVIILLFVAIAVVRSRKGSGRRR